MEDTNRSIEQECSELARAIAPLVLDELITGKGTEDSPHGRALTAAVYRACDQLENQGSRSNRIALQLLEALARYELALGRLLIAGEEPADETLPLYKVQWCSWVNGGGLDMQEWHPSDWDTTDECEAIEKVKRLDIAFAPRFRHRFVQVAR